MKYLIVGLGNIGDEYHNTRHNVGFKVLDALAKASNISFTDSRYGAVAELKHKGRTLVLLKPSTFMNRSGMAVNYWLKAAKIPLERTFIVVDDLALPFGKLRIRPKGGAGGHNGLTNIEQLVGAKYARLRFGIGNDFHQGQQINYVLGEWSDEENNELPAKLETAGEIIKSFTTIGLERTMNQFNT